jgi:hypothetical protein
LEQVEVTSKRYLRYGKETSKAILSVHYKWRHEFGKVWYRAWWNSYWSSTQALAEKQAGWDVISRMADLSWWEWKEGSAPFYWR